MPDRSNRSQRGGGFISINGLTPPELPDYQGDLNKQLSFLKSMDAYMNGSAGGGGGTIRNANGLTPYQQAQMDYKLKKDAERAAAEEAKKNVVLGVNPKTGEPIIYRNESGYKLSDKRVSELYGQALDTELRKDIANDEELNRINGILFGPKPISIAYRKDLERQARDRTKALASIYKIDDRTAFDAVFGDQSKAIRNEQQKALKNESFLDVLGAGIAQGWSDFVDAVKMPTQSAEERLETGREAIRRRNERIAASPTLREREMREQEAAERGEEIGYWEATDQNRPSNFAASVAGTLTSFAPAIAVGAGLAPITGGASLAGIPVATGGAALATGYLGAGMNQLGQAERAAQDPNLTEEQKRAALSMDDSGFATTSLVGGAAGMLMPGSVSGGVTRMAGKYLGDASARGIRGALGRAAEKSIERAGASRSFGTLARDIAVNSGENAAIMGANTVGANAAYNMSTGQPLSQGVTQGALGAIGEGAVIGVPFGGARTLRRARVPRAETPAAETPAAAPAETAAETPATTSPSGVTPTEGTAITWAHKLRADENFRKWEKSLLTATRMPRDKSAGAVDKVIAEYLAGGGRLEDLELIRDSFTRKGENYISDEEFAKTHNGLAHLRSSDSLGWAEDNTTELGNAITRWKEVSSRGELNEKISGSFTKQPGESRVASILAELKPEREGKTSGSGNNTDSTVEADTGKNATDVTVRTPVPVSTDNPEIAGKRPGGTESPNNRPVEGDTTNAVQETAEQQASILPADLRGAREGGVGTRDGAGGKSDSTVGRDGSPSDAAANSGQEQPASQSITAKRGTPKKGKDKGTPDTLVVDGATFVRQPGVKSWKLRTTKGKKTSDLVINTKGVIPAMPERIKNIKPGKRNEELTKLFDSNVDNGVRESRVLPRQQYTSAGTSRKQIPESFKKIPWKKGTRNLDIGAGKHDLGTDYLRSKGVENVPFDPYNRSTDVNNAALNTLRNGEKFDTVTVANLLNVVQEPEIRDNIIKQAAHSVKPDGKAYFQVYESDRSGVGRQTKTGGSDDNWQNARTLKSYQPDIEKHFGKVESKDGMLIASEPKDPGPVEWQLNKAGDTVREARGWHGTLADFDRFDLSNNRSGTGGNIHGYGIYIALEDADPRDTIPTWRGRLMHGRVVGEDYRDSLVHDRREHMTITLPNEQWSWTKEAFDKGYVNSKGEKADAVTSLALETLESNRSLQKAIESLSQSEKQTNTQLKDYLKDSEYYGDTDADYVSSLKTEIQQYKAAKRLLQNKFSKAKINFPGRLYEVETPDLDVLLHEHRTLSEQSAKVQKGISRLIDDISKDGLLDEVLAEVEKTLREPGVSKPSMAGIRKVLEEARNGLDHMKRKDYSITGRELYDALEFARIGVKEGGRGDIAASRLLNKHGIEGVYYVSESDGPCAVVFNDKAIQILNKERRIAEGSAVSPEVINAYLTTPKERKLAAMLNSTDVTSPLYPSLLQQFTDTLLKKFKGLPNRQSVISSIYPDVSDQAVGWYDPRSRRIGLNPENVFDQFDTVESVLHTMSHEIGHGVLDTRVPRSVRTAISRDAYNTTETDIARAAKQAYSDKNPIAQGEEIFVETAARENPFLDPAELDTTAREYAEDMVYMTLDGIGANNSDSVAAARELVHFLATNAPSDIGNFGEIATRVLTSNKDVVEAFTNPKVQTSGLMQELATDYRNKVKEAGLKNYSKDTMADYLSAVLDPNTSMDVYARTSRLC